MARHLGDRVGERAVDVAPVAHPLVVGREALAATRQPDDLDRAVAAVQLEHLLRREHDRAIREREAAQDLVEPPAPDRVRRGRIKTPGPREPQLEHPVVVRDGGPRHARLHDPRARRGAADVRARRDRCTARRARGRVASRAPPRRSRAGPCTTRRACSSLGGARPARTGPGHDRAVPVCGAALGPAMRQVHLRFLPTACRRPGAEHARFADRRRECS